MVALEMQMHCNFSKTEVNRKVVHKGNRKKLPQFFLITKQKGKCFGEGYCDRNELYVS